MPVPFRSHRANSAGERLPLQPESASRAALTDERFAESRHAADRQGKMLVVFVVAMFMTIMDTTIVNVALPTISRELSVPLDRVDGVSIGFLVGLTVFIPASGWLGDRFGTKRIFLGALAIFTLHARGLGVPSSCYCA